MSEPLFTAQQAAARHGCSTRTVHRIIQRLDLGQKVASGSKGVVVLTAAEVEQIGRHIKPPGNPRMSDPAGQAELQAKKMAAHARKRAEKEASAAVEAADDQAEAEQEKAGLQQSDGDSERLGSS